MKMLPKTTTTVDIRNFFNGKNSAGNREKAAKNQLSKNISLDKNVVVIDD